MSAEGPQCSSCHFMRNCQCHRSPPVRLPRKFTADATAGNRVRDEAVTFSWPEIKPTDWCGEYKPRFA